MRIHGELPIGACVHGLRIIAQAGQPKDLVNRVEFLPT